MSGGQHDLTPWEYDVLAAVKSASESDEARSSVSFDVSRGWLTGTQVFELSGLTGPNIRPVLHRLREDAYIDARSYESIRLFRVNAKGTQRLATGRPSEDDSQGYSSESWTGIIDAVQIGRVSIILSEMEDVCERITNNHDRAQIYGLIRALECLLTIPEPPRQGVVALVRDPAFANIVQVATFLAALIAAVKS